MNLSNTKSEHFSRVKFISAHAKLHRNNIAPKN